MPRAIYLFVILLVWMQSCGDGHREPLPYLGGKVPVYDNNGQVIDSTWHRIPPFSLIDQDSQRFTRQMLEGKVFVTCFFFTSCPSICPRMIRQMQRLRHMTDTQRVVLLSITIDPKRDTPKRLRKYIASNDLHTPNWYFLTGSRDSIYPLGMEGFKLAMAENSASPGGFVHSEHFVLCDDRGHIRGFYKGTDAADVSRLARDIEWLLEEEQTQ